MKDINHIYAIHQACVNDPRVQKELGGFVGFKLGGIGAVPNEDAVHAPMYGSGLVSARPSAEDPKVFVGAISKSRFNLFGLEAEIGFVMGSDLGPTGGAAYTEEDVFGAVAEVVLSVECYGRRFTVNTATTLQKLADTMSAAGVICGARFAPSRASGDGKTTASDLRGISATMRDPSGKLLASGNATANPLGSPVASLTWCANHLNSLGLGLRKGQLIIAGAICKTRDFVVGDPVLVDFGEQFGAVRVTVES